MTEFQLKFDAAQVTLLAQQYGTFPDEDVIEQQIAPAAKARGYLTRDEFLVICRWKSPRNAKRFARNDEQFVRAVTSTAFSVESERLRIEVLTLFCGVDWPTASVILHWCSKERYPLLDFRALWSLTVDVPKKGYDFEFWWEYTLCCRRLADESGVSMRVLDRALWRNSKANQAVQKTTL